MSITAIIPVREGSRRLKNKNVAPFAGTNLLINKINQLKQVSEIDNIVVSSDSELILAMADSQGVIAHKRAIEFCDEKTKTFGEVVAHVCENVPGEDILWATCTAPLVFPKQYREAIQLYRQALLNGYDSLASMEKFKRYLWDENGPVNYELGIKHVPSQQLPPLYFVTDGILLAPRAKMIEWKYFHGSNPYRYILDKRTSIDINDGLDLACARAWLYMESTGISKLSVNSLISILRKKSEQFWLYLQCSWYMNHCNIVKTFHFLACFMNKRSLYEVVNSLFPNVCNADVSYVYGSSWVDFYKRQYGEVDSEFVTVGYPELEAEPVQFDRNRFRNPALPVICYLAQTSVEDGVIDIETMRNFLCSFSKCLTMYNVVLKLHPRSDSGIYNILTESDNGNNILVWQEKGFPRADMYIGHETTLIARAMYVTDKTLVVRLKTDRVSPFEKYSRYTAQDSRKLLAVLERMAADTDIDMTEKLQSYAYYNKNGALAETAKDILSRLSKVKEV